MFQIRSRRSAGVPVTAAVHRLLVRGNAARDRQDCATAAILFRQALKIDPELAHIWLQLGNMEKDQGHTAAAEHAYLQAISLRHEPEAFLQLGHLFNGSGDDAKAGESYLRAFQLDPSMVDAATALHRTIARSHGRKRQQLLNTLRGALKQNSPSEISPALKRICIGDDRKEGLELIFDVSDLLGYFTHSRLPTGIQRVQIMVITQALLRPELNIGICGFLDGWDEWFEIPAGLFQHTVALSLKSGNRSDAEWVEALHQLNLRPALAPPFVFPQGAYLVNLGSSWQLHNYFLLVRDAKARSGIRYVPFIHDLIPIVAPQHFTRNARREFVPWVVNMFTHADHFLVCSEATRHDVLRVGDVLGRHIDPTNIAVIPLNTDFRTAEIEQLPVSALRRWSLGKDTFALLVSTVESRKGHATALDAWAELIARHGLAKTPMLVCVGKKGWLSEAVYQRLQQNQLLATRVMMLPAVSDAELSLLYRTCLFTVYPSLYEGWGLPITEALSYGKPVIASDTSSLTEAGGNLAVYVEPGSSAALAAAVERMAFDVAYRTALVARIQAGFKPRSWGHLAEQIEAELVRMAALDQGKLIVLPIARIGAYHSVARSTALSIWPGAGCGEMFRAGTGWSPPDAAGSWTRRAGGKLHIGLPPHEGPLRVGLLLLGSPHGLVDWRIKVENGPELTGSLDSGGRKWVTFTYTALDHLSGLRLHLLAEASEDEQECEDEILIGLAGFFIYEKNDVLTAMRLLEAIAFGNLEEVDAYRQNACAAQTAHRSKSSAAVECAN